MSVRLGPVQRALLLLLADGEARSVARIESDLLLSPGRARGALDGLARRGLVDRDATSGHGLMLWALSGNGQTLAEEVHGLTDDAESPRCPHGRPEDEPCKGCRLGPWRCSACGELVRGGQRAPHRYDAHGETRGQKPRVSFTWAG